ncbi:MAG: hypothetical protein KatS3mg087_1808 [Patescibacteria group bacterium]|nr:MAG: hypothetical protein KatS3mg087_1808 [Patescibacteria group bacterium]
MTGTKSSKVRIERVILTPLNSPAIAPVKERMDENALPIPLTIPDIADKTPRPNWENRCVMAGKASPSDSNVRV